MLATDDGALNPASYACEPEIDHVWSDPASIDACFPGRPMHLHLLSYTLHWEWQRLYRLLDGEPRGGHQRPYVNNCLRIGEGFRVLGPQLPFLPSEGPDPYDPVTGKPVCELKDNGEWMFNEFFSMPTRALEMVGLHLDCRELPRGPDPNKDAATAVKTLLLAGAVITRRARDLVNVCPLSMNGYSTEGDIRVFLMEACTAPAWKRRAWWLSSRLLRWRQLGGSLVLLLRLLAADRAELRPLPAQGSKLMTQAGEGHATAPGAAAAAGGAARGSGRGRFTVADTDDTLYLMHRLVSLPECLQRRVLQHMAPTPAKLRRLIDQHFDQVCCDGQWHAAKARWAEVKEQERREHERALSRVCQIKHAAQHSA